MAEANLSDNLHPADPSPGVEGAHFLFLFRKSKNSLFRFADIGYRAKNPKLNIFLSKTLLGVIKF